MEPDTLARTLASTLSPVPRGPTGVGGTCPTDRADPSPARRTRGPGRRGAWARTPRCGGTGTPVLAAGVAFRPCFPGSAASCTCAAR